MSEAAPLSFGEGLGVRPIKYQEYGMDKEYKYSRVAGMFRRAFGAKHIHRDTGNGNGI